MPSPGPELQHDIEQFLYREAELLDQHRYEDWVALFTDDTHYWVPIRETTTQQPDGIPPDGEIRVAHYDDDKRALGMRLTRLQSGLAHSEGPPSRTRRLVSNVRIQPAEGGELVVKSNFMLFQSRREAAEFLFVGEREDRLRQVDGAWRIARRKVILDHNVLPRALSVFF
jgi:3-phenylpropionate/cinnamic acid dioxygenase small subunit